MSDPDRRVEQSSAVPPPVPSAAESVDPDDVLDTPEEIVDFDDWSDASVLVVGEAIDEGRGRIFPCDQCGADLRFHIGEQSLKCPFCGFVKALELDASAPREQDYESMLSQMRQWHAGKSRIIHDEDDPQSQHEVRCESCGGNVAFIGTLTSQTCPYCDSPIQLDDVHRSPAERIPADGVLPFLIDQQIARDNVITWVSSRWFAPNSFRNEGGHGKFSGVYLSYFTFDSMTFTRYSGERGEDYFVTVGTGKNRRTERRTRWYSASGRFQRFFDDVLVLANTGLRRDFMLELEPWPLNKVAPFNQQMLAGYFARTYDIELDQCFVEARERIDQALYTDVCHRIGGDRQRVHGIQSRYEAVTFKHLLLPVWLLAYRYRNKTYQVFINASTGEVQGERPWSIVKIAFAVLLGIAVVGVIVFLSRD